MGTLDWSTRYTEGEWADLRATYDKILGPGEVDELFKFVPFMHDVRPDALKRYRLWVNTVTQGFGLAGGMPNPPVVSMLAGHFYTTLPYPQGIAADLFLAKRVGGRRQEVADILGLAWLHAGPFGMNVASGVSDPVMKAWDPDEPAPGLLWPDGWDIDPDAFRCGVDFEAMDDSNGISSDDLAKIEGWYERVQGEVPHYVRFLARHYPLALKTFRARFETSMTGTLPKQFIALTQVHLAASWMRPDAVRRTLHMARVFGITKAQAVQSLVFSQLYLGDVGMDAALEGVDAILDAWD